MNPDLEISSDHPDGVNSKQVDSVVVFNHTVVLSGGELALLSLINGGLAKKVHVHVDVPGDLTAALDTVPGDVSWSAIPNSAKLNSHVGRSSGILATIDRLRIATLMRNSYKDVLKQRSADVIYANTLRSVLILCTLNLRGRPLVFHQRDRLSKDYLGFGLALVAKLLISSRVRHVIANSQATAETTPKRIKNVHVIPSAVSDEYYELGSPDETSSVVFVMVGRLAEWKGQREFLKALVYLRDKLGCTDWSAVVVGGPLFGETEYERQLRAYIVESGLQTQVRLAGHTKDVPSYIEKSHVLVHASIVPEPFGQVVAQGMASGRAVVAASTGGPASMIDDNVSGLLVDPNDTEGLAEALLSLVESPSLRQRLGTAAKASAESYRVEYIGNRIRNVLNLVRGS